MWPLIIKFVPCKHCFIALPKRFIQEKLSAYNNPRGSNKVMVFKLEYLENKNENITYVSWNGAVSSSADCIELDEAFGNVNGIKNNQLIILKSVKDSSNQLATDCSHCSIVSPSSDDYEVLMSNIEQIENLLIHNVRVVTNDLTIPLWLFNGNMRIFITITKIHPKNYDYVLLSNRTELTVEGSCERSQEPSQLRQVLRSEEEINKIIAIPRQTDKSTKEDNTAGTQSVISSVFTMVKSYLNESDKAKSASQRESREASSDQLESSGTLAPKIHTRNLEISELPFRVLPVKDHGLDRRYLCSILINPKDIDEDDSVDGVALATIVKILSPLEISQLSKEKQTAKHVSAPGDPLDQELSISESYFRSSVVLIELDNSCKRGTCQVPYNVRRRLGLTISSKVKLNGAQKIHLNCADIINVTPLEGNPLRQNKEDIKTKISVYMKEELADKFLIVAKYTLINLEGLDYLLSGSSDQPLAVPYLHENSLQDANNLILNRPMITRVTTSYGLKLPLKAIVELDASVGFHSKSSSSDTTLVPNHKNSLLNDTITMRMKSFLENQLHLDDESSHSMPFHCGSILLYGSKKCGKTYYTNNMSDILRNSNDFIYTSIVSCKQLRGKRTETFKKFLTKSLAEAYYRQPSVLFLDDIDSIIGKDQRQTEESGPEAIYRRRMIVYFISLLSQLEHSNDFFGNQVAIVSTCSSLDNLDNQIISPEGRHYFTELIEISTPNHERRVEILKNLTCSHDNIEANLDDNDFDSLSQQCDSFLPIDLKTLLERAIMKAAARATLDFLTQNKIRLSMNDMQEAIKGYIPLSLRGITLQEKSGRKFAQIGGMNNAKETLISTVLLPTRYPTLFSKCPIRLQTSVLLYGPPGCGKTLIAEALANEESMNLICVRGPELLSKYIGASEAAVRDLFRKAEAAKPCIVFFDEFESIAPRRGHDSTGVTDRVVNQLLTMIDGVEELSKGIFILAATSRPDLIDPALLRPGRFDKHVYCGLPDEGERLEILEIMCSKINLDDDVDLVAWAKNTQDFSGADLQSFLYTSQLKSLHQRIDGSSSQQTSREERHLVNIVVGDRHLRAALNESVVSIKKNNSNYSIQYPEEFSKRHQAVSPRATLA